MRLEINIPDERPEAQILGAITDPGAYILELIRTARGSKTPSSGDGMPDYTNIFAEAQYCPSAFNSREQVDQYIDQIRSSS